MKEKEFRTIGKYKILALSLMVVLSISVIMNITNIGKIEKLKQDKFDMLYTAKWLDKETGIYWQRRGVAFRGTIHWLEIEECLIEIPGGFERQALPYWE